FGTRSSLPWAVRFPGPSRFAKYGSPAYELHVRKYDLAQSATASFPVHPMQLYESLLGLMLLGACLLVLRYRKIDGMAFLTFVLGYGVVRFRLEFIRDDEQRGSLGSWSTSQIIAVGSSAAGVVLFLFLRDRARRERLAEAEAAVPEKKRKRR